MKIKNRNLLDGLVRKYRSIFLRVMLYFSSQNTGEKWKYPAILHTNPSNKRFIFYLKEYKIELSINLHACLFITRICDRLTWVQFSCAFSNAVTNWSEVKTCQTGLLSKSFFFSVRHSNICQETDRFLRYLYSIEWSWIIINVLSNSPRSIYQNSNMTPRL